MSDITSAIKQICDEKDLSYEAVISTIESALAAAYRKDFGQKNQNIQVEFNDDDIMKSKVYDVKTVVEDLPEETEEDKEVSLSKEKEKEDSAKKEKKDEGEKVIIVKKDKDSKEEVGKEEKEERKFNPRTEIQLSDAKMIKKNAKINDEIKMKLEPPEAYGRMAAQTAKQVIIQRLREAERETIFNDFKEKENEVVSGVVQRREGRLVLVDLGKSVGVLPPDEQIYNEKYLPGERIKVYVKSVSLKPKGPEIILSRISDEILKKVFYLEIPEIANGLINLKNVAREAGFRSKVAVFTDSENVDPIGSCVGQRGARIQTIISELGGEKVDIIQYDDDSIKFISNSLSPAKIISIEINEKNKKATVMVSEDQLSLAIGKGGQNARLAAKLTGWKIDIVENKKKESPKDDDKKEEKKEDKKDNKAKDKKDEDKENKIKKEKKNNGAKDKGKGKDEAKKNKIKKEKKEDKK